MNMAILVLSLLKIAIVHFTPIQIIKSESDGIWLTGLGEQADIIVLGQGFVRAGDKVEAIFDTVDANGDESTDKQAASVALTTQK